MSPPTVACSSPTAAGGASPAEPWLDIAPPDPAGLPWLTAHVWRALTPDGRYYAYGYLRTLSDLFLVGGCAEAARRNRNGQPR